MANLDASTVNEYARVPDSGGNLTGEFVFAATAANSAPGDVIRLCKLPAGSMVSDIQVSADAANAGLTVSAGWAYVDGSADAAAEFVAASTALATATLIRGNTTGASTVLLKDAYLTLTLGGADVTNPTILRVRPTVQMVGNK